MIPAKIELNPINMIKENSLESIVDWFDRNKHSFYILGWSYLKNQQQMEELFYQAILKVHKELPRFKKETSFETWVTSIFIHTCKEISYDRSLQASEQSEPRQELFKALDQLEENEREALILTYVKGISQEEAAQILQVSVEKMKENLFSGILLLRKVMGYGSAFNGCKEYHKNYLDYLNRSMDRAEKVEFEVHIYHCEDCQEDLATFQEVMLTLLHFTERMADFHVPSSFMENIKARLAEKEKQRQQKNRKRTKIGIVFASVFVLLMGLEFLTGAFTNLYYTWVEEDQQLRSFLQQDLGERLNLEAENKGVKITIKSVISDEVQTLVFYEIEDTNKDNQYAMNYSDGVIVENELEIMNSETHLSYFPPDVKSKVNKEKKNVYQGKFSLFPLKTDKGTIKLKITKLQKLIRDASNRNDLRFYGNMEYQTGEWSFEIPVIKQPSIEYALDTETKVEGIPIRFEKLTVSPTATVLQYGIKNDQPKKRIDALNFDSLKVNNKKVKTDMFGNYFFDSQQSNHWNTLQTNFGSLFGEKPKAVNIQLGSVHLTFEDKKTIELDSSKEYPQTFEYAGSTISIDKVEVGQPTNVVISNHEIENRAYESLQLHILDEGENEPNIMEMNTEGILVDKNGINYIMNEIPVPYEKIQQPRYFITVQTMGLQGINAGEKVIPKRVEIIGYNTTKYLDDVVKISLK
jgi:RNA polymerase sigma factor (sigma-70 family)